MSESAGGVACASSVVDPHVAPVEPTELFQSLETPQSAIANPDLRRFGMKDSNTPDALELRARRTGQAVAPPTRPRTADASCMPPRVTGEDSAGAPEIGAR